MNRWIQPASTSMKARPIAAKYALPRQNPAAPRRRRASRKGAKNSAIVAMPMITIRRRSSSTECSFGDRFGAIFGSTLPNRLTFWKKNGRSSVGGDRSTPCLARNPAPSIRTRATGDSCGVAGQSNV